MRSMDEVPLNTVEIGMKMFALCFEIPFLMLFLLQRFVFSSIFPTTQI